MIFMKELKTLRNVIRTQWIWKVFGIAYNYARWSLAKLIGKRYIQKTIGKKKMLLKTYDNGISRALMLLGMREKETFYILEKTLKSWDTVLDLGANIGYYVLLEHTIIWDTGKIYAIEPEPDNFALLQRNIDLNTCENVETIYGAVSDHEGTIDLYLSDLSNVHSIFDQHEHGSGKIIQVPSLAMSSFIKDHSELDLIRMDIEGAEVLLFRDIVANFSSTDDLPNILFEAHGDKYDDDNNMDEVLQGMLDLGYTCTYFATSGYRKDITAMGYQYEKEVMTDGFVRYVYKDIADKDLITLLPSARTLLLTQQKS